MSVTVVVPRSEPTEIRRPEGDAGQADSLAQSLHSASGRYEQMADTADDLRNVEGWIGRSMDAYGQATGRTATEHSAMSTTVERVGRSVTAYADTLRDLLVEWETLTATKRSLDRQRQDLLDEIARTDGASEADVARLRAWASSLSGDYATLVADHAAHVRRVAANEENLRQAFANGTSLDDALSADGGASDVAAGAMGRPGAPGTGASPEQTKAWWDGLSEAEQEAVVAAYPHLVGSADGLPASARDDANRVLLDDDLATLSAQEADGTLSDSERRALENARATERALASADAFTDPLTGDRPGAQLWLYDPTAFNGDGRVALAIGDLDTARDVSVQIPGITTEMNDVPQYGTEAANLYESARYNGDGSTVATMFWLGYDAPESALDWDTVTEGRAADGGARLADAVDGLRASRSDDPAHMTAIGHSYGSTTTAYAATDHGLDVDDVALIGSPGAGPADTAADFSVGADHVYDGRNSNDLVGALGDQGWVHKPFGIGLGVDPSSEDFGATRFEAESTDRNHLRDIANHSRYYDHDTESLYNLGRIVDGHGYDVNVADHTYDPWWGPVQDPEIDRDVTTDVPGRSDTTGRN